MFNLVIFLVFSGAVFSQEIQDIPEIWDDPRPANIVKELQKEKENEDEPPEVLQLAQAGTLVPSGTPPPKTEEDVSDEEKSTEENIEYFFKAKLISQCLSQMTLQTKYAQSAEEALAALNSYKEDCLPNVWKLWDENKDDIIKGNKENKEN